MRRFAVAVGASAALMMVWTGAAVAQGRSEEAHHHVIVCHRTGSDSNPYAVINIPMTAWSEAHDPNSSHAHPPLNGRVDILLKDPASGPGGKDGFTKEDCLEAGGVSPGNPPPPLEEPPPPLEEPPPPSEEEAPGGGAGPGGALGEEAGAAGAGELPFTGMPVAILGAAGLALMLGGMLLRRIGRTDS